MLDNKRPTPILAVLGACALMMTSVPAFAQAPADPAAAPAGAPAAAPATTPDAAPATMNNGGAEAAPTSINHKDAANPISMFLAAELVVKVVMLGLLAASVLSWTLLILKLLEFARLNGASNKFVEAFRGARSIADINRISTSEEFEGNPLADMAAAASGEVELSRQAGLQVNGANKDSTIARAQTAVSAVQSGLAKRLSGGMTFLASVGSAGPFIGLFGTVYGIMISFIGIANTNTTNLAVVAPGIAQALLATGIGLFAAIPSVIFYNIFQVQISSFGTRTDGFIAELLNAISRQLDKGA
jgi:biopolymer transport protein ExbB